MMVPSGGYLQDAGEEGDEYKVGTHPHELQDYMKLGSVQKIRCAWYRPMKGYPDGRVCRSACGVRI